MDKDIGSPDSLKSLAIFETQHFAWHINNGGIDFLCILSEVKQDNRAQPSTDRFKRIFSYVYVVGMRTFYEQMNPYH